ncbi:unnamed protein product [Rotaria sordida]|uniref:TIR domain-containing protein n=1 Tax=Rotaria sordida TaxID=392033 RepID=A0A815R1Q4_9BILA|nr:unnamed protein product [Rotaria sordida]CAF1471347.1 unnamed protein product [Rotaria sordida]CAF3833285.1 unnamed protein product [Rotaria sordida]CAF4065247.1 unnamed protein product [Rotaria sordida]
MARLSMKKNHIDYWVEDNVQKRFFEVSQFCTYLQEYLYKYLSSQIEISIQNLQSDNRRYRKQMAYRIRLVNKDEHESDKKQFFYDLMKKFLKKIPAKFYNHHDKVLKWFSWNKMTDDKMKFLQKLLNKKVNNIFTVLSLENTRLCMYYLPTETSTTADIDKLMYFIQNGILQEVIQLPLPHERSQQLENDLNNTVSQQMTNDEVLITYKCLFLEKNPKQIVILGYNKKVIEIKKQIFDIIERNIVITYKLNLLNRYQIENFIDANSDQLEKIEIKYSDFGVKLRLRLNEFSAPRHLKNEIESCIEQFWSRSSSITTFNSIQLPITVAENVEQHLLLITERTNFSIKTKLKYIDQSFVLPKASIFNNQISKSIEEQSNLFSFSSDVFKKITLTNGYIELRTGDIASQKVDTIIISTMFNGLKEGVIERLGSIDYQKTFLQNDGTMYTETNGGKLNCKQILFSNWLPKTLINTDDSLRLSIQTFMSKSMEFTIKEQHTLSIAFAVPDSCRNETILAEEMINEAKQHIEMNKLQLNISFVCLPEQQTLYEQFFNVIQKIQEPIIYFEWPTAIIEITILVPKSETDYIAKCQQRINRYISRCTSTIKLIYTNGVFQSWDQHTINSFYKYCKDRCILPKLSETNDEIELIGSTSNILEAEKKLQILAELVKQKQNPISLNQRPNSASTYSARSENMRMGTLYNIVVSYSKNDKRKCQRLINRLSEEGFSIGTTEEQVDLCAQMDKCDCIILCISENYYENDLCRDEAKYAFQTDKKVFLVKIQSCPILGWDNNLFEGKLFFHSYGSNYYFDLEYERLLIQLLQYTKPGFVSMLKQRLNRTQQRDVDEYRELPNVKQQSFNNNQIVEKSEKIKIPEFKNPFKKLPSIPTNTVKITSKQDNHVKNMISKRELSFFEERWLRKLIDISKRKSFLFTPERSSYASSGRHQFEIPANHYKIADSSILSIFSTKPNGTFFSSSCWYSGKPCGDRKIQNQTIRLCTVNMLTDESPTYGHQTGQFQIIDSLSQVFPTIVSTPDFIPRRVEIPFRSDFLGHSERSEKQMEKRRELDNPENMKHIRDKLAEYFINKYKHYTKTQMNVYLKFAQRMKDNAIEFEKFCSTATFKDCKNERVMK